jgi:hypothetical protein
MLNSIKSWFTIKIIFRLRDFFCGLKNLFRWFPTIWKNRDWDHYHIYEILRFKLETQARYLKSNGCHLSSERDAQRMILCAKLCKAQQDEYYANEYLEYQKIDHRFNPIEIDGEKYYEMSSELISEDYDSYFSKYPRQYKKVESGEINRFKISNKYIKERETIAMEVALENQERSRRLLFKLMEENIEHWWS